MDDDEHLRGYDACFFCSGASSVGISEQDFTRITYDTTLHFASVVLKLNPGLIFCYISGKGTDSTELSKTLRHRVKG
ncbi:hypothetical protein EZS27_023630 [termite gut metagenome]|uniref:Uncharacterized protein n=1 Tax=termite gut metagenome TaxID=433724 RepID=A0A5J4R345_9ZZZZ